VKCVASASFCGHGNRRRELVAAADQPREVGCFVVQRLSPREPAAELCHSTVEGAMSKVFISAELCPMPCLMPVIFVRCRTSGLVFAWCVACGCARADPAKESWQRGDLGNCSHPCLIARRNRTTRSRSD
jgi:hypothetical protein